MCVCILVMRKSYFNGDPLILIALNSHRLATTRTHRISFAKKYFLWKSELWTFLPPPPFLLASSWCDRMRCFFCVIPGDSFCNCVYMMRRYTQFNKNLKHTPHTDTFAFLRWKLQVFSCTIRKKNKWHRTAAAYNDNRRSCSKWKKFLSFSMLIKCKLRKHTKKKLVKKCHRKSLSLYLSCCLYFGKSFAIGFRRMSTFFMCQCFIQLCRHTIYFFWLLLSFVENRMQLPTTNNSNNLFVFLHN